MQRNPVARLLLRLQPYSRVAIGVAALALFMAWAGGFFHATVAPGSVVRERGTARDPAAAVFTVQSEPVARIDVVGTAQSEESVHLSARVGSYVSRVFVSAGDAVTNGQQLLALDDRELRESLAAAEAHERQAETEYNRTKALFEKTATTEQALTAADALFASARAEVARVDVMLTYARITSPIDGVIADRRMEAGDLVNPGQPLLTVYRPDRMRLEAPVPVRLVDKVKLGQEVEVRLDRGADALRGTVAEVVGEIDPQSRTQKIKVRLDTGGARILPGTFGRLWLETDPQPGLLVPATAVYRVGQLEYVQLVAGPRVLRRLVRTGSARDARVEVLSGLHAGDVILVQPVQEG